MRKTHAWTAIVNASLFQIAEIWEQTLRTLFFKLRKYFFCTSYGKRSTKVKCGTEPWKSRECVNLEGEKIFSKLSYILGLGNTNTRTFPFWYSNFFFLFAEKRKHFLNCITRSFFRVWTRQIWQRCRTNVVFFLLHISFHWNLIQRLMVTLQRIVCSAKSTV